MFPDPEYFDILGAPAFLIVALAMGWSLATEKPLPRWTRLVLLLVGAIGFLVDVTIVYTHFLVPR